MDTELADAIRDRADLIRVYVKVSEVADPTCDTASTVSATAEGMSDVAPRVAGALAGAAEAGRMAREAGYIDGYQLGVLLTSALRDALNSLAWIIDDGWSDSELPRSRWDTTRRDDIEHELRVWAANGARRDRLFRSAWTAGLSKLRISELTGVARTTIDRIPGLEPGVVRE